MIRSDPYPHIGRPGLPRSHTAARNDGEGRIEGRQRKALPPQTIRLYGTGMIPRNAATLIAPLLLTLLAACANASPSHYPSLAIRDFERVKGTATPAEPAPPPPPPPAIQPDEALSSRLQKLRSEAEVAHGSFMAAAPRARAAVSGAAGSARGSDRWTTAEVALSDLESTRARAMLALADLDNLKVSATLENGAVDAINATHTAVSDLLAQEDRIIDELVSKFPG